MKNQSSPAPSEISAARHAACLTQTQAATLIHTSLRSWQQWEHGDRRMHPAMWELFQRKAKIEGTLESTLFKQQQEIDKLRRLKEISDNCLRIHIRNIDQAAQATFLFMKSPENLELQFEIKNVFAMLGFCPRCERRDCDCGGFRPF
jgi:transcriptional regulator with XRE-family HTH domain